MILQFPDLDTLRLALTSGAVPANVSLTATSAGFDDHGQVWLRPSVSPSRAALTELRRLRVQTPRTSPVPLTEHLHSWPQVFPVVPEGSRVVPPEQAPVLFDLSAEQFAAVASEILRLGNDRQSFRYLEGKDGDRVLLRVIGPPYYTLLRALDPDGPDAPVAHVECAPRAWIQIGHTHPFACQIKVPEGKLLLLRPPRQWSYLPEGRFREVYEVLEFPLPNPRTAWKEGEVGHKLKVPLRLVSGDPGEVEELWVLRDRPMEQLDELVANAGDDLLQKLSFAVAEQEGQTVMVLRVRPSKGVPPAPVLDAVGFRTYLKLPNLFVPSGKRLHPPLSRHVLRKLLAEDPAFITWLYPHDDGTFTPETLPDEAFRPLSDWIDYVLDHDRQSLQTWVQAAQFDFEYFVCAEEETAKPKKPPATGREKKGGPRRADRAGPDDAQAFAAPADIQRADVPAVMDEPAELPQAEPSELEHRLKTLEEEFLSVEGPLDGPERVALWPAMAQLNVALGRGEDAGSCWLNALWSRPADPSSAWCWFRAEASRVLLPAGGNRTSRSWAGAAETPYALEAADLDHVLSLEEPTSADVRALAAYVFWAAGQNPAPAALAQCLPRVRRFFERYEQRVPVRAAWLAALGLARMSGGDALGLARARDRLLERLYQNGLRPEQDLAPFLQAAGQPSGDRLRAFRQWLVGLSDLVRTWLERQPIDPVYEETAKTPPYADLLFAFGLARLGETESARRLLERAASALANEDEVHGALLRAFSYRVEQALAGKRHEGALPREQLNEHEQMEQRFMQEQEAEKERSKSNGRVNPRYLIERMRQHSRVLEPDQKIDAYQTYQAGSTPLDRELVELPNLHDRTELAARVERLLQDAPKLSRDRSAPEALARVLKTALGVAPRVGEDFALVLLGRTGPVLDALPRPDDVDAVLAQADLLETALFAAGHFDRLDHVQALVGRFQKLLEAQEGQARAVQAAQGLAGQCFRGLRKLGLRDEIDRLLRKLQEIVLTGQDVPSVQALVTKPLEAEHGKLAGFDEWLAALTALLPVAGGWYYFGRDSEAEPVLEAVRSVLFQGRLLELNRKKDQLQLACDYLTAVAQAPVAEAQRRIEEFFRRATIKDGWTTASHFALLKLRVIEAAVTAIVSDDGRTGGEVRRWLDEDEFLVRRGIHRDLREAMSRAGH
jgi:hypothetical protein